MTTTLNAKAANTAKIESSKEFFASFAAFAFDVRSRGRVRIIGAMIAIVWQLEIRPGREAEFEQFYGADGDWTAASRHSRSYLGSSFLRDQADRMIA